MSQSSSSRDRFVRRSGLHAVEMDGELVMMGLERGEYYGMREVAARVWELLREPRTIGELRDVITSEYDVDAETCERDLLTHLRDLAARNLVTRWANR